MGVGKRGISAIVATVLIILITVAAVTIIWIAIIPMINDNMNLEGEDVQLAVISESGYTAYDNNTGLVSVQVERGDDEEIIEEIQIIISVNGTTITTVVPAPLPGQLRTYTLNLSIYGVPYSVTVAPIYLNGGVGSASAPKELPEGNIENASVIYDAGGNVSKGIILSPLCGNDVCEQHVIRLLEYEFYDNFLDGLYFSLRVDSISPSIVVINNISYVEGDTIILDNASVYFDYIWITGNERSVVLVIGERDASCSSDCYSIDSCSDYRDYSDCFADTERTLTRSSESLVCGTYTDDNPFDGQTLNGVIIPEDSCRCEWTNVSDSCVFRSVPVSYSNTCIESDGGTDYDNQGLTLYQNTSREDYCVMYSPKTLVEYSCDGNLIRSESYDCPNGCFGGECAPSNVACIARDYCYNNGSRAHVSSDCIWSDFEECSGACDDGECIEENKSSILLVYESSAPVSEVSLMVEFASYLSSEYDPYVIHYTQLSAFSTLPLLYYSNGTLALGYSQSDKPSNVTLQSLQGIIYDNGHSLSCYDEIVLNSSSQFSRSAINC